MSLLDDMRQRGPILVPRKRRLALLSQIRGSGGAFQTAERRRQNDLDRILALPRRPPLDLNSPQAAELAKALSARLKTPQGTQELFPVQAWALAEAEQQGGLFASIGVGHGKTLLDILAPMVVPGCQRAVLFIPPQLRAQFFDHDWEFYGQHWKLPNLIHDTARQFHPGRPMLHVVPYSQLQHPNATELLTKLKPDLIIADEAHCLKAREAVRTGRFLAYMAANPKTRFCCWSGTLTKRSLTDFAHLGILALRERAPVPLTWGAVEEWAAILDPAEFEIDPGPLARLCAPNEPTRKAFHRRFFDTHGCVKTVEASVDIPLVMRERKLTEPVPAVVREAIQRLATRWERPDGEELMEDAHRAASARQIACGFYYRWKFTHGETDEQILLWLARRKAWHQELREKLTHPRPHLDSPFLCSAAAARWEDGYSGELPVWKSGTWPGWVEVRDTVKPVTEPVWLDDFLARDAARWIAENVGICWYEHDAFGRKVAELSGAPLFGPGEEASEQIKKYAKAEHADHSIICSIRAHSEGKNLQGFSKNLVANPPGDGGTWEQMLGRTHRKNQEADEVLVLVYRHVEAMVRAVDKAQSLAAYIEEMLGTTQRLLKASASNLVSI